MDRILVRPLPRRRPKWSYQIPTAEAENIVTESDQESHMIHPSRNDELDHIQLRSLFKVSEWSPRTYYELHMLARIFSSSVIDAARKGAFTDPNSIVAWVCNVKNDGETIEPNGLTTVDQFKQMLHGMKRARASQHTNPVTRRLYIPNPSPLIMCLLILAASQHEIPFLRTSMFKYLTFATSIRAEFPKNGPYALEFHLPCYTCRENTTRRGDLRPTSDHRPIRESFDISFLSGTPDILSTTTDFLYESQTSMCVIGWNLSQWTALRFTDTYFHDHSDSQNPHMLPFLSGIHKVGTGADASELSNSEFIKDPREYFLVVIQAHVARNEEEWSRTLFHVRKRIEQYLSHPEILLSRRNTNLSTVYDDSKEVEASEAWIKQTDVLLVQMINLLANTTESLTRFLETTFAQFTRESETDEPLATRITTHFSDIADLIENMNGILLELTKSQEHVKRFRDQLALHIAVEDGRYIRLQYFNNPLHWLVDTAREVFGTGSAFRELRGEFLQGRHDGHPDQQEPSINPTKYLTGKLRETFGLPTEKSRDIHLRPPAMRTVSNRRFTAMRNELQNTFTETSTSGSTRSQYFSVHPESTKPSSIEVDSLHSLRHQRQSETMVPSVGTIDSGRESEEADDDIIDIQSILSLNDDIISLDDSGPVDWDFIMVAVSYVAGMLTDDPELRAMYQYAISHLDENRFMKNHRRLLKSYYILLQSQAHKTDQTSSIAFLRSRKHRNLISSKILGNLSPQKAFQSGYLREELQKNENRGLTIERYLRGPEETYGPGSEAKSSCLGNDGDDREVSDNDEQSDSDTDDGEASKFTVSVSCEELAETRQFLTSGVALTKFKTDFRDFLFPKAKVEKGKATFGVKGQSQNWAQRYKSNFFGWIDDVWKPPTSNHHRIRYTCACGENMFLDVKELSLGGVVRFCNGLSKNGATNIVLYPPSEDSTAGPSTPLPAYFRPTRNQSDSPHRAESSSDGMPSSSSGRRPSTPTSTTSWSENDVSIPGLTQGPQYLLMCIKRKGLHTLVQVECSSFKNDQYLFQEILKEYTALREASEWKPSSLLPLWSRSTLKRASTLLQHHGWVGSILQPLSSLAKIRFYKMSTADFVKFHLVPVREETVPRGFKRTEFPPCAEVKSGNYLYRPVPMNDVELDFIPLSHLTLPGKHSDDGWLTMFPKKLHTPLSRLPGVANPSVVGWGIIVNEVFNWTHFLLLALIGVVLISIVVAVYWGISSDASSAFGLGAFLVAVCTLSISLNYSYWQDRLQ